MKPKLYTIGCPKCKILEEKLEASSVECEIIDDMEEVKKTGFQFFPVLEVDGELLDFSGAINWLKNLGE